jgi:hypothetical protein
MNGLRKDGEPEPVFVDISEQDKEPEPVFMSQLQSTLLTQSDSNRDQLPISE